MFYISWAVVVVKWSACSPSNQTMQVWVLLKSTIFFKILLKRNENKQKRGRGWPFKKEFYSTVPSKTRDWFHRQISEFLYRQCWSKALLLVNVSWLLTSNHNALFQFYATLKIFMIFAPNLKINVNPELFVIVGCT